MFSDGVGVSEGSAVGGMVAALSGTPTARGIIVGCGLMFEVGSVVTTAAGGVGETMAFGWGIFGVGCVVEISDSVTGCGQNA